MRSFLKRGILFTILAVLCLYAGDFLISRRIQPASRMVYEGWYNLMRGKIDADLVVIGSSRAALHVNPAILDSTLDIRTYNLGMIGANADLQLAKYHLFRTFNRKPSAIVHCVDVNSMQASIPYQREQYFPWFWNRAFREAIFPIIRFSAAERLLPLYRFYGSNSLSLMKREPTTLYKGFKGMDPGWHDVELATDLFSVDAGIAASFEDYLAKAAEEGISVVLVFPPLYHEKAARIQGRDELFGFYEGLAREHGIPFLDYSGMALCRDTAYFADKEHLNIRGADIFTDSLARDLIHLGLK